MKASIYEICVTHYLIILYMAKYIFAEENTKFVYFGNWLLTQFLTGFRSNIWFGFFEILVTVIEHY